jgi:hypothetical protein
MPPSPWQQVTMLAGMQAPDHSVQYGHRGPVRLGLQGPVTMLGGMQAAEPGVQYGKMD